MMITVKNKKSGKEYPVDQGAFNAWPAEKKKLFEVVSTHTMSATLPRIGKIEPRVPEVVRQKQAKQGDPEPEAGK